MDFGKKTLMSIKRFQYGNLSTELKFNEFQIAEQFRDQIKKSWLINLLAQYWDRGDIDIDIWDALWYKELKSMVYDKSLYMVLMEIPNWAFPDDCYDENRKLLESIGIKTYGIEKRYDSDGSFIIDTPVVLGRIYSTDEDTPKQGDPMDFIEFDKGATGEIEFGYQPICKSMASLRSGEFLLRVPYESNFKYCGGVPVCALFVSINDIKLKNSFKKFTR